jgi:hypothetical protein
MSLPQSNVTDFNPFNAEELVVLFADRIRQEFPLGNKPLIVLRRKPKPGLTREDDIKRDQERIENTQSWTSLTGAFSRPLKSAAAEPEVLKRRFPGRSAWRLH